MISPFCPKCRSVILPGKIECPECHEPVRDRAGVTDSLRKVEAPSSRGDLFCPSCHGLILGGDNRCSKCGMLISASTHEGSGIFRSAERTGTALSLSRTHSLASQMHSSLQDLGEGDRKSIWTKYLQPSTEEMSANFFQIKTCDYITNNERHRSIAENEISFEYDLKNFSYNAEAWPKDQSGSYKIKYFVGKAIADRVVAAAVSCADFSIFGENRLPLEETLTQAFLSVRRMRDSNVTLSEALQIVEGHLLPLFDEIRLGAAREISNKVCRYVIAHEFAHILLGHVDLPMAQRRDPDIRKNNERQSDTFASNTINASLDREFAFLGGLLTFLHFICLGQSDARKEGTSHPAPFERFELLLKNKSSLDSFCARFRTSEKSLRNIAERLTRA